MSGPRFVEDVRGRQIVALGKGSGLAPGDWYWIGRVEVDLLQIVHGLAPVFLKRQNGRQVALTDEQGREPGGRDPGSINPVCLKP